MWLSKWPSEASWATILQPRESGVTPLCNLHSHGTHAAHSPRRQYLHLFPLAKGPFGPFAIDLRKKTTKGKEEEFETKSNAKNHRKSEATLRTTATSPA